MPLQTAPWKKKEFINKEINKTDFKQSVWRNHNPIAVYNIVYIFTSMKFWYNLPGRMVANIQLNMEFSTAILTKNMQVQKQKCGLIYLYVYSVEQ